MGLYVDENGEEQSKYDTGWMDGKEETLDLLTFALGDRVRAGTMTLATAVALYAEAAGTTQDVAADILCEFWAELLVARLQYGE